VNIYICYLMRKITGLDALRAIAVLLVIHAHWGPYGFNTYPNFTAFYKKIIPSGGFAVDFFFVLSGFLITGILLRSKQETTHENRGQMLKTFIVRRSLRIFPIYYLCLLLLFIINYQDIRHYIICLATYTSNFVVFSGSYIKSFNHAWSLAVEEQFYLIWPFVIIFLPDKYLLRVMVFVIIASTIIDGITENIYGPFSSYLTFNCFNAFAIGGLYSFALLDKNLHLKLKKILLYLLPVVVVFYVLALFNIKTVPTRLTNAILSINLIIYIAEKKYGRFTAAIVENKLLNSLGKISYGLYLFHPVIPGFYYYIVDSGVIPMGSSLYHFLHFTIIAEIIHFAILLAIAYLSYYLIEANILKLKKRFEYEKG